MNPLYEGSEKLMKSTSILLLALLLPAAATAVHRPSQAASPGESLHESGKACPLDARGRLQLAREAIQAAIAYGRRTEAARTGDDRADPAPNCWWERPAGELPPPPRDWSWRRSTPCTVLAEKFSPFPARRYFPGHARGGDERRRQASARRLRWSAQGNARDEEGTAGGRTGRTRSQARGQVQAAGTGPDLRGLTRAERKASLVAWLEARR